MNQEGLVLKIQKFEKLVGSSEVVANNLDFIYGSFRIIMKVPKTKGSVTGFFLHLQDSTEISMNYLTSLGFNGDQPTLLSGIHSRNTDKSQLDPFVWNIRNHSISEETFYEYRFDWLPHAIHFYFDGNLYHSIEKEIPSIQGSIVLNHWSNGDPDWSQGPPSSSQVQIQSFTAYYNTSGSLKVCRQPKNLLETICFI